MSLGLKILNCRIKHMLFDIKNYDNEKFINFLF